ncbi:hypothetical protein G7Z17_g1467 [Cylindrodendrum hubeiense]|uniref:Uncharacterized protein n=1 Tax=Cylindrodendrum hubeiense TaxID=595255 RepID=A0A9P5LM46_9HYPO|nr:hypothetical protein G7Z17_g1467 [Cylindrodendrum hubeiense]
MSRLFPHPPYAEDQPLPRTFMTVHILTRAVVSGSLLATVIVGAGQLIPSRRRPLPQFTTRLLRASFATTLVTMGLSEAFLLYHMRGKEEIEWQDRSWRLLDSDTQRGIDDWTYVGMAAGPAVVLASKGTALGLVATLGAGGLGANVGVMGYLAWKFGIRKILESKEIEKPLKP